MFDFTSGANQPLIVTVDSGSQQTISLNSNCDTAANCAASMSITGATAAEVGGVIVITSDSTGSTSLVSIDYAGSGPNALGVLGATASGGAVEASGVDATAEDLVVVFDGATGSPVTVTITSDCSSAAACASSLLSALQSQAPTGQTNLGVTAPASVMVITSATLGSGSAVSIQSAGSGSNALSLFGSVTETPGTDAGDYSFSGCSGAVHHPSAAPRTFTSAKPPSFLPVLLQCRLMHICRATVHKMTTQQQARCTT